MPVIQRSRKEEKSDEICECCLEHLKVSAVANQASIDDLPVPILVFELYAGTYIITTSANKRACEVLGRDRQETVQHLVGNVFACVHACLPEGCGRSTHCSGCALRNVIVDTYQKRSPQYEVQATLKRSIDGQAVSSLLSLSTIKSGNMVILRLGRIVAVN